MAVIRCSVESCHYYGEGDYCTADEIYVKNRLSSDTDDDRHRSRDMEVGAIGQQTRTEQTRTEQTRKQSAVTSSQTCCETFRSRHAGEY